jgi:hypothetical protein
MPSRPNSRSTRRPPRAVPEPDRALRRELLQLHALEALNRMRAHRRTLHQAARDVGESPRTIIRLVGPALRKDKRGRYVARAADSFVRPMEVVTRDGKLVVPVRGSKQASLIGSHWNAIRDFLEGRPSALRKFRGKVIQVGRKRHALLADPRAVKRLGEAGELSFETIYSITR